MRFGDLKTGDLVNLCGTKSVVLAIEKPHPDYPTGPYWLIVWWLFDERRMSFDCLHPDYAMIPGSTVTTDGLISWKQAIVEASRT